LLFLLSWRESGFSSPCSEAHGGRVGGRYTHFDEFLSTSLLLAFSSLKL